MSRLDDVVDAYEHTVRALLSLGHDCAEADFARPTECPGWSVQDQFSHVAGIEAWMLGRDDPPHTVPEGLEHVRTPLGAVVEVAVDLRRARSAQDVVAELADLLVARLTRLHAADVDPQAPTRSPMGEMPLLDATRMRTMDIWMHEQDVRRALGRPGNLGSPAAQVSVHWLRRVLPRVVGRAAGLPPGTVVDVEVTGPVAFRDVVEVRERDGRTVGAVLETVPQESDARIVLGTEAYTRRTGGRWTVEDTPADVTGDPAVADAVLRAMAVTP